MSNKAYPRYILTGLMREDRIHAGLKQEALGMMIHKTQHQMSDIENGIINPSIETMIRWFTETGAYEHVDLIQYMYDLHPLAAAPVTPELNDDAGDALINLQIQIDQAEERMKAIQLWLSNLRPNKIQMAQTDDWQQVYDVYRALQSFLYAGIREYGLDIHLITDRWTNKARVKGVAMTYKPRRSVVI
jgi:Helix-turn-helix.